MIDRKRIREIIGYTYQNEQGNHNSWYNRAISFHESSKILYEAKSQITNGSISSSFNAALSLELILKAILAAKKEDIKAIHDLRILFEEADIKVNVDQKKLLDYLTATLVWLKYPTPKKEEKWDEFHDVTFERLINRSKDGNTTRTMANHQRIPSLINYLLLWEICMTEYKRSISE